jgi:antitoxin (DNA-binding transcriptional repressor) of toxin-antitoxin stability system
MRTANFTEFRRQAKGYFAAVGAGDTVRILRHGKPIADLVPVTTEEQAPAWKQPGLRLYIRGAALSEAVLAGRRQAK